MNKVLILNPYYFPGYRSGGPQQTIKNIVDAFGDKCEIYILTQNHDLGIVEPYENIATNVWIQTGNAKVKYLSAKDYSYKQIKKAYEEFEVIYACGLFEIGTIWSLIIHRLNRKNIKKLYVAPMGVFSEGAMSAKALKKRIFLYVFRLLGMFKNIDWSFTSELELLDARKNIGRKNTETYIIAEDLPRFVDFEKILGELENYKKEPKTLKIIFLSRICAKKNLAYCADILNAEYDGEIQFDIYGIKEDLEYWSYCEEKFKQLPENIHVNYCGEVKSEEVIEVFKKYDVFLFPTKGENFGHVIYEALVASCIPIISDETPWKDLDENGVGSVMELNDIERFRTILRIFLEFDMTNILKYKRKAIMYARNRYFENLKNSGYRNIFKE